MTEKAKEIPQNNIAMNLLLYTLITAAAMIGFTLLMQWRFQVIFPALQGEMSGNGLQQAQDIASAPLPNVILFGLVGAIINVILFPIQTAILHFNAKRTEGAGEASLQTLFRHTYAATALLIVAISPFAFKFAMMPLLMVFYIFDHEPNLAIIVATLISLVIGSAVFYWGTKILQRVYGFNLLNAFASYAQAGFYYGVLASLIFAIGSIVYTLFT